MKNTTITVLALLLVIAVGIIVRQNRSVDEPSTDTELETLTEDVDSPAEESSLGAADNEEIALTVGAAELAIVGTWRSDEDEQSVITFEQNGTFRDVYGGGVVNEVGTYQLLSDAGDVPLEAPVEDGVFLRESFGEDDYYYVVTEVTENSLSLIYLPRGNVLEYTKIND